MGRVWLLLVAAVWCSGARAQDVILLRNAEEIRAEVREVTDTHLIYRLWDGPDEVLMLPRSEVFSVTYRNGMQDFFMTDRAVSAAAEYPWPAVTKSYRPGDLFDEDGVRGLVISVTDGGRHGLLLSLDQAELPWVGEANRQILAGTVEMISGWTEVRYAYHGGVALGTTDCSDGWNTRLRLLEALPSIGFALSDYPAFAWCEAKGAGWYLPSRDELKGLWTLFGDAVEDGKFSMGDYDALRNRFNACMARYGGDPYPRWPAFRFWSSTEKDAARGYGVDVGCRPEVVWRSHRKPYGTLRSEGESKATVWSVRAVHKF